MKYLKPKLDEFAKMDHKYKPYILDLTKQFKLGLMKEGQSVILDLLKDIWKIIIGHDPESVQRMNCFYFVLQTYRKKQKSR